MNKILTSRNPRLDAIAKSELNDLELIEKKLGIKLYDEIREEINNRLDAIAKKSELNDLELIEEIVNRKLYAECEEIDKYELSQAAKEEFWLEELKEYEMEARRRHFNKPIRDLLRVRMLEAKEHWCKEAKKYISLRHTDRQNADLFMKIFNKKRLWLTYDSRLGPFRRMDRLHKFIKLFSSPDVKRSENVSKKYAHENYEPFITVFRDMIKWKEELIEDLFDTFAEPIFAKSIVESKIKMDSFYDDKDEAIVTTLLRSAPTIDMLNRYKESIYHFINGIMIAKANDRTEGRRKYIDHLISQIHQLEFEYGIRFFEMAGDLLLKYEDIDIVKKFEEAIKYLIEKNRPYGRKNYKPEGLLAKLLDYVEHGTIADYEIQKKTLGLINNSFKNPVFLNYLYEGRLPAYSWSAASGEEMMRALKTGEYEKSYDAEERLIKNVNKKIYSKHPLGK